MIVLPERMVITSNLQEARRVERKVLEQVQRLGYGETARFGIRLALEEAINNAIKHGNEGDPAKGVEISFSVTEQQVEITVADQGDGFDPDSIADPTTEENLQKPSGRGIMLMRAYVDEVRYSSKGNAVTLIKRKR